MITERQLHKGSNVCKGIVLRSGRIKSIADALSVMGKKTLLKRRYGINAKQATSLSIRLASILDSYYEYFKKENLCRCPECERAYTKAFDTAEYLGGLYCILVAVADTGADVVSDFFTFELLSKKLNKCYTELQGY